MNNIKSKQNKLKEQKHWIWIVNKFCSYWFIDLQKRQEEMFSLVSTHVVCERLSVMQRHPESGKAKFVLKILRTPCSDFQTPSPHRKWKFRQILALWVLTFRTPLPPGQWRLQYVETNRCIPQGYHLILIAFKSKRVMRSRMKQMALVMFNSDGCRVHLGG